MGKDGGVEVGFLGPEVGDWWKLETRYTLKQIHTERRLWYLGLIRTLLADVGEFIVDLGVGYRCLLHS